MAQMRKTVLVGIHEVGAVRAAADVSFGKTAPDGVTIAWSGTDLEVESGQSSLLEEVFRTANRVEITFKLIYSDLLNLREALGLPDSALTGDLNAGVPTAEVLSLVEAEIGSREDTIYVIGPGPVSTRRFEFARCKVMPNVSVSLSRDNHVVLEFSYKVLRPKTGTAFGTVTDAI